MNIVLTGMRASGKTSLGKELAKKLGWKFVDIDHLIEAKIDKKIDQYVKETGWEKFRALEHETALECAELNQAIISTGGGTMINSDSAKALKKTGFVVLLTCPIKVLGENLNASYERPSLKGEKSALEELEEIWKERKEQYHAVADITHDTSHWPNINKLIESLRKNEII
ncbi:shikimate kinase [Candidatus Peregrinibacteria bacterium]|jgi:shikimate kinase|nr:shikimate kinase [Candidatus Peregrinibacteria bacterium]MBT7483901.1 shikimate kinase [Candidatus Peregrinibacteria bacterium]MBT7702861.1 shikimate kinase [Candidatus Peregrinibacteria bacterium]